MLKKKLQIKRKNHIPINLNALVCETQKEKEIGLSNTTKEIPIMVFEYEDIGIHQFWMKNTKYPLDIIFCLDNKIVDILHGKPNDLTLLGDKKSNLIIEGPKNLCKTLKINIGDDIKIHV